MLGNHRNLGDFIALSRQTAETKRSKHVPNEEVFGLQFLL